MAWIKNEHQKKNRINNQQMCRSVYIHESELLKLTDSLDSPDFTIGELFSNKDDYLTHLVYLPFKPTTVGDAGKLSFGLHRLNVNVTNINNEGSIYDLGEYYVPKHFNNFADYNGYTRINIFLPYYGIVDINPNDVVGKYLQFRLSVNYQTGNGTYIIGVSNSSIDNQNRPTYVDGQDDNTRILGTYITQIGQPIPIGRTNASEITRNITMGLVKSAASVASFAFGEATGAFVTTTQKSSSTKIVKTFKRKNASTGGRLKMTGRNTTQTDVTGETVTDRTAYNRHMAINDVFSNSISALNGCHFGVSMDRPNDTMALIDCSNSIYVVIYRPKMLSAGASFNKLYGKPVGEVKKLVTCRGYTEIADTHFEGEGFGTITDSEKALLFEAFGEGIIFPE